MKKIVILLLILLPLKLEAASNCDTSKHQDYMDFASYIKQDKAYSNSSKTYTITFYNVVDGLRIKYDDKDYYPNSNSQVVIRNVRQGVNSLAYIYGDDNCSGSVGTVLINTPYYNPYYGTYKCEDYVDKIPYCSSQYTSVEVTDELLETAISDYHIRNKEKENPNGDEEEKGSFLATLIELAKEWGIKLALVLISSFITVSIFSRKFRKIRHGI